MARKIPGVSFSAKRALGVTKAKQRFARATGIPTTRAGMQRKIGGAVTGGGCLLLVSSFIVFIVGCVSLLTVILQ
jgi:hypothetical protein